MKILIVGNSQVAPLKAAHNRFPAVLGRLGEVRFYSIPGGSGPAFLIENGRLRVPEKAINPKYPPFADPADTIDLPLDYYDGLVVSALGHIGGSFLWPSEMFQRGVLYDFAPHKMDADSKPLSRACYREIIRAEMAEQTGIRFLAKLRGAYAGRILVQPFPRVSSAARDRDDWSLREIYQDPVGAHRFFSETRDEFLAELCADLGAELLPYPAKTLREDHLTPMEYVEHIDGLHPNKEYGRMVLENIVQAFCGVENQPSLSTQANPYFSLEVGAKEMDEALCRISRVTSRAGFSMTESDLALLNEAELAAQKQVRASFARMREVFHIRRTNLELYGDLTFVSLGEDCFSRTVATQWGLKKCARLGELSHPFDLALHPLPVIVKLLESDFAGYPDQANLVYDEKSGFCRNTTNNVSYNHERGMEFAENGFELLLGKYRKRIENFRACLKGGGKFVFLVHLIHQRQNIVHLINDMASALRRYTTSTDMLMIFVRTPRSGTELEPMDHTQFKDIPVRIVDVPYPAEGYVWYDITKCLSPEGHEFEKKVVEKIRMHLDAFYPREATKG